MTPPIVAEGLTKIYRADRVSAGQAVRAIDAVDLTVETGEVVLLMGPSGSGKSTLLSILGCILRPTSGRVRLNGRDVTELGSREQAQIRSREIGFVFQDASLFPSLTAIENVEMPLELQGIRGRVARRRAEALLESVGLGVKRGEYPRDLSGGEKQRVAIARALAGNPGILLADEPTAALDLVAGQNIYGHLRRLAHEEGRAVVAVSHDHRMVEFATRVVRLEDGKLVRQVAGGRI